MKTHGHHSDGSGVQKHSTVSCYPFIVGVQEGLERKWFVMAPSGEIVYRCANGEWACDFANEMARLRREGLATH